MNEKNEMKEKIKKDYDLSTAPLFEFCKEHDWDILILGSGPQEENGNAASGTMNAHKCLTDLIKIAIRCPDNAARNGAQILLYNALVNLSPKDLKTFCGIVKTVLDVQELNNTLQHPLGLDRAMKELDKNK